MKSCCSVFVRLLLCLFALALASCSSTSVKNSPSTATEATNKVLFVGNSLTYVGNLPAVFDALCQANGQSCQSDMVVQGGATLSDHWSAKTVQSLIESKAFDTVVLQERGGDVIGMAFGSKQTPEAIKNASSSATQKLAELIKSQQQNAFYLGTYQSHPDVSEALEEAEKQLAKQAALPAITYSNTLIQLKTNHPKHAWFHQDGGHPGAALTLLQATMLYHAMFGVCPDAHGFEVNAPLHEPSAKFSLNTLASTQTLEAPPRAHVVYDQTLMAAVVASCRSRPNTP